jgi:hypothetical protein
MALTDKQVTWVNAVGNIEASLAQADTDFASREEGMALIEQQLDPAALLEMQNAFRAITVEYTDGSKPMPLLDFAKGDPLREVDSWADLQDAKSIDPAKLKLLTAQVQKIMDIQREMEALDFYKKPGMEDPDFPSYEEEQAMKEYKDRIARDLWQPLMREGIIPENFIPDDYSEVVQTFNAASDEYDKRLQEYSAGLDDTDKLLAKFGIVADIGGKVINLAASSAGFAGSIAEVTKNAQVLTNAKEAGEVLELINVVFTSTCALVPTVVKERDAIKAVDICNTMLGAALKAGGVDQNVADMVTGIVTASARSAGMGKALAEGDLEGAFTNLGAAIESALGSTGDKALADSGKEINSIFGKIITGKAVLDALRADPPQPGKALEIAIGEIAGVINSPEVNKTIEILSFAKEVGEEVNEIREGDKDRRAPITAESLQKLKDLQAAEDFKAARAQEEALRVMMERDDAMFAEVLSTGFPPPTSEAEAIAEAEQRRMESIENLIAIMARDKKIFALAEKIATKGPGLIADLVPGMGLVQACAELAFSIAEAVKRAQQMLKWMGIVEATGKAATVQLDAMMSRYNLEGKQNIIADIKVGVKAVKVAGQATALSPAAPIGLAISAGADVAEAAIDLGVAIADNVQAAQAWKIYKDALANPQNRKLARQALRKNPTLSKYAMAYGAVVEGNAMAKMAMNRCGLNDRTLAQADTNVSKVVDYLEQMYDQDPVIMHAVGIDNDWHPGDIELTYDSFCLFYLKATSKAKPLVAASDVGRIKADLASWGSSKSTWDAAVAAAGKDKTVPDQAVLKSAEDAITGLIKALKPYKAKDEENKAHAEMDSYIKTLVARATLQRREVLRVNAEKLQPLIKAESEKV